jgi:hypothetical protein
MDISSDVAYAIVMMSYLDMSSDVAHAIVLTSYMDTSCDIAHAILVTSCMDASSDVGHAIVLTSYMDTSSLLIHKQNAESDHSDYTRLYQLAKSPISFNKVEESLINYLQKYDAI